MASHSEKNLQQWSRNVPKLPKISLFEPKKNSKNRMAISKRRRRTRINYSQINLATDSEKTLQYVLKMCQNGQICYFLNQKKVKQRDRKYRNSSLVDPIDCKNTKERENYLLNALSTHWEKILQYLVEMCQNCLKCHFLNQEKSERKG